MRGENKREEKFTKPHVNGAQTGHKEMKDQG